MGLQRVGHNWATRQRQQPCHSIAGEWDMKEWSHSRSWANPWDRPLSEGSRLHAGKNSRVSHSKGKVSLSKPTSYRQNVVCVRCWRWSSDTLATWCEELTHWKRPWCWERRGAGGCDCRGWDSWMASLTQRTWVWANSGREWRTGKPGMLESTGWERIGLVLGTEQQ